MDVNKIKELKSNITERLDELIDMFIDLRDEIADSDEEDDNNDGIDFTRDDLIIKKVSVEEATNNMNNFMSKLHPVEQTLMKLLIDSKEVKSYTSVKSEDGEIDYVILDEDMEDWINEPEKYIDMTSPKTEEWEVFKNSIGGGLEPHLRDDLVINLSTSTADARLTITGVPFKDIPLLHTLIDKVCKRAHEEADEAEDFEIQEEYIND